MVTIGPVKTTFEIPQPLFRKAKAIAARKGCALKQLVHEALSEKIARVDGSQQQAKAVDDIGRSFEASPASTGGSSAYRGGVENIEPEDRQ